MVQQIGLEGANRLNQPYVNQNLQRFEVPMCDLLLMEITEPKDKLLYYSCLIMQL